LKKKRKEVARGRKIVPSFSRKSWVTANLEPGNACTTEARKKKLAGCLSGKRGGVQGLVEPGELERTEKAIARSGLLKGQRQ